jgi:hypothetical protein
VFSAVLMRGYDSTAERASGRGDLGKLAAWPFVVARPGPPRGKVGPPPAGLLIPNAPAPLCAGWCHPFRAVLVGAFGLRQASVLSERATSRLARGSGARTAGRSLAAGQAGKHSFPRAGIAYRGPCRSSASSAADGPVRLLRARRPGGSRQLCRVERRADLQPQLQRHCKSRPVLMRRLRRCDLPSAHQCRPRRPTRGGRNSAATSSSTRHAARSLRPSTARPRAARERQNRAGCPRGLPRSSAATRRGSAGRRATSPQRQTQSAATARQARY